MRFNIGYEVPGTEYGLEQPVLTDKSSPNAPSLTPELRQDPLQRSLLTFFCAALFLFFEDLLTWRRSNQILALVFRILTRA